jgi:hypothetical protein
MLKVFSRGVPAILLCLIALPAFAQTALSLDPVGCIYREGDDVRWAAANLDESGWQPLASWPGVATRTPYYWLRCKFEPGRFDPLVVPSVQVTGDLVLRVDSSGQLTLANAGHIPPYLNGREIAVDAGLPLGLTADVTYDSTILQLSAGDSLTLLTDGVLEARDATGELFGFERTAAISSQAAEAIAELAQRFGQEDDITVLTLTLMAAEVAHA